jgi:hypothetical protein
MSTNPIADQKFILELTRQDLHDLWLACCDGRKHRRHRMETPTAWPVHNLAGMRSALRRLEELEKRLGQALLGCQCKDCGANPYWDIFTLVDGPIQPRLCERCESDPSQGKEVVTVSNLTLLDKSALPPESNRHE